MTQFNLENSQVTLFNMENPQVTQFNAGEYWKRRYNKNKC